MNKTEFDSTNSAFFQIGISWWNFITFFSGNCNAISQLTA